MTYSIERDEPAIWPGPALPPMRVQLEGLTAADARTFGTFVHHLFEDHGARWQLVDEGPVDVRVSPPMAARQRSWWGQRQALPVVVLDPGELVPTAGVMVMLRPLSYATFRLVAEVIHRHHQQRHVAALVAESHRRFSLASWPADDARARGLPMLRVVNMLSVRPMGVRSMAAASGLPVADCRVLLSELLLSGSVVVSR
jgi:hypothetical protein